MTIDDESSVYVGGLPYNVNDDSLRDLFAIYGSIVAVKIINDRSTRGKCYGFVTFTNPRSAIDAINDMDGRTINGRVVRVNGVKTRGGRWGFGREGLPRSNERGMDRERGRHRERDYDHDRDRHLDRYSDRSRERGRSRDHDLDREREYEHAHGHDYERDHLVDRDEDAGRDVVDDEQEHSREHVRIHDMDTDGDMPIDRRDLNDANQFSRKRRGSSPNSLHSRELSSDLLYDSYDQTKEQLEISIQKHEELKDEISHMEETLDEKQQFILELQKKSKKLEDSLTSAKKLTSRRKMQLTKLHKCYLQIRDYSSKLKSCEQELQSLVDSALAESDFGNDTSLRRGVLVNGNV